MKNTIKNVKRSKSNALSYVGDIHVKIVEDDRIYYENYFHNHGTKKLFNFFIDALIGNYTVAKSSRPCKIILFKENDDGTFTKVSNAVYYDSTAIPGGDDASGSVTYHFRIPFLALESGTTVKRIGLYPNIISNEEDDLCAYYDFTDGNEIEIPTDGNNYTIIIEWKLIINNAK